MKKKDRLMSERKRLTLAIVALYAVVVVCGVGLVLSWLSWHTLVYVAGLFAGWFALFVAYERRDEL